MAEEIRTHSHLQLGQITRPMNTYYTTVYVITIIQKVPGTCYLVLMEFLIKHPNTTP